MSRGPAPEPIGAAPVRPVQLHRLDLARRALADRYAVPVSHVRGRTVPELEHSARALAAAGIRHTDPDDDGPAAA